MLLKWMFRFHDFWPSKLIKPSRRQLIEIVRVSFNLLYQIVFERSVFFVVTFPKKKEQEVKTNTKCAHLSNQHHYFSKHKKVKFLDVHILNI